MSIYADEDALEALSDDVGGLWCRPVAVMDSPPDSSTFLRDYVHPHVPCIIKNAIQSTVSYDQAAPSPHLKLTLDDLIHHVGVDTMLTVDVTPDGHGDCIRSVIVEEASNNNNPNQRQKQQRRMFVKPHEELMNIGKFRELLRKGERRDDGMASCREKIETNVDNDELGAFPLQQNRSNGGVNSSIESCAGKAMHSPVVYYSRQNDCLRTEVSKLFSTNIFPTSFPFAEQAFGTGPPDAINLWIGNEQSVSSMHKDHYENLFYVCSGQKEFILCPPADVVFLHEGEFSSGTFCPLVCDNNNKTDGEESSSDHNLPCWAITADNDSNSGSGIDINIHETCAGATPTIKWIEPDLKKYMETDNTINVNDIADKFPLLSKAHPIKVLVSEGEMIYIPSLWYHRVTQTCETVGVNYWFDMKFDNPHWCYFNFLQNLKKDKAKQHEI